MIKSIPAWKGKRLLTTRDLMEPLGMKTTKGVILFLKRENLAVKIGGRYKIDWRRVFAQWPELFDNSD